MINFNSSIPKIFGLGVSTLTLFSCGQIPSSDQSAKAPNIIFIMVDDLGYGDLGVYGQTKIRTPEIDKMAAEGILFTDVYAGSTVCAPSRSVLLTGQHTGNTTVRGNFGKPGMGGVICSGGSNGLRVPLTEEDTTIAQILKIAGYNTGITGKWGLGEPGTSGIPNRKGFDQWYGLLNQRRAHSHYPEFIWHNQEKVLLEGNTGTLKNFTTETHHFHDLITDFALQFIKTKGSEPDPFFLYIPYTFPHDKFQVTALEPYAADSDWSEQEKVYATMVTMLDRDTGRILQLLKEMKIDENTIVFFCSDNGAADRYDGLFNSSGNLTGRKRSMYDGGLRTPMIVWWPGTIQKGMKSDAVWYFADVLPTLADLAGVEPPKNIDGVSVLAALLTGTQESLNDRPLYWEFFEVGFQQAARKGDWKAVRLSIDQPIQLFNLKKDPGEENNIADSHPEMVSWFESYFITERTPSRNWPSPLDVDES
jgi:arylsulfatase A-like enzyme